MFKKTTALLGLLGLLSTAGPLAPQTKTRFTMTEIIALGLDFNPSLTARLRDIEAGRAAWQAAKQLPNPEIELSLGRARSYDGLERRGTGEIALSQRLENPFSRKYRIRSLENGVKAAEEMLRFDRLDVTYRIKRLLFSIMRLESTAELAEKNLAAFRETHQIIRRKADLGEVKELEAIKLEVETLKARNELNRIRVEAEIARDRLNAELGNRLPPDFQIEGGLEFRPVSVSEEDILERTLLSYPRIQSKQQEVEMAKNTLSAVKWQRWPEFKLSGFIDDDLDGRNKGIGISLDIPLWNFKSREIAESEYLWQKQEAELQKLILDVSADVRAKLKKLDLSEQALHLFRSGLIKQAEESLRIAELSYRQGELSLLDYLDSQRTYYSIQKDFLESLYIWSVDLADLEKSIGAEIQ